MASTLFQAIAFLLVFSSILFIAFVATKYIGKKSNKAMRGKYISIVETVNLGLDKHIHLVKVDEQFVLIASSGKSIEFLTNVTLEHFETTDNTENDALFDFKSFFDKYLDNFKNKSNSKQEHNNNSVQAKGTVEGEVFKGNLNKLRSITERPNRKNRLDGDDNTNEE